MADAPVPERREVPIGQWISEAWQLTTAHFGEHVLLGLVVVVIMLLAGMTVIGNILIGMAMACGCFNYARQRMLSRPAVVGDVFRGFDIFGECVLASLIYLGIGIVASIAIAIVYGIIAAIGTCCAPLLILIIPITLVSGFLIGGIIFGLTVLTPGLLYERRMKAWDAIKLSYAYGIKNPWMIGLYGIVVTFIAALGSILTCGIGCIVTTPFTIFAGTLVYRDWVGFAEAGPAAAAAEEALAEEEFPADEGPKEA